MKTNKKKKNANKNKRKEKKKTTSDPTTLLDYIILDQISQDITQHNISSQNKINAS